jgi:hypothetical protein
MADKSGFQPKPEATGFSRWSVQKKIELMSPLQPTCKKRAAEWQRQPAGFIAHSGRSR